MGLVVIKVFSFSVRARVEEALWIGGPGVRGAGVSLPGVRGPVSVGRSLVRYLRGVVWKEVRGRGCLGTRGTRECRGHFHSSFGRRGLEGDFSGSYVSEEGLNSKKGV